MRFSKPVTLGGLYELQPLQHCQLVRRAPSDRYYRRPKRGQLLYWKNRKRYLVSTKGKLPAGLAMAPLGAGHYGFIVVRGSL